MHAHSTAVMSSPAFRFLVCNACFRMQPKRLQNIIAAHCTLSVAAQHRYITVLLATNSMSQVCSSFATQARPAISATPRPACSVCNKRRANRAFTAKRSIVNATYLHRCMQQFTCASIARQRDACAKPRAAHQSAGEVNGEVQPINQRHPASYKKLDCV